MLTFLVWAAGAYAAIWAVAAILFYWLNRVYRLETVSRARDMRTAAFLGVAWPVVLALLVWLAWQEFRSED